MSNYRQNLLDKQLGYQPSGYMWSQWSSAWPSFGAYPPPPPTAPPAQGMSGMYYAEQYNPYAGWIDKWLGVSDNPYWGAIDKFKEQYE